eukprot:TRINITY_DN5245_c0_g1_i1.p1 TRINITY_DN5245_c0_g1~~TRINITY_DN5245_c0_g1_i1.p1  ORF type:complete len:170 (-),score=40.44 TRINITY_DN5245_c0_g1_i1:73-582(-)
MAEEVEDPAQVRRAVALLKCDGDATGVVYFRQNCKTCPVNYRVKMQGIKPGKHGFHIHTYGDLSNGCTSAGDHFNPDKLDHGGPSSKIRHAGDLGNVLAGDDGNVNELRKDRFLSLRGKYNILGRSVVVHANEDDLGKGSFPDSKTTGHAGARICCGVIGLAGTDAIDD